MTTHIVMFLDRLSPTGPPHPERAYVRITKSPKRGFTGAPSLAALPKIPELVLFGALLFVHPGFSDAAFGKGV